MALPFYNQGDQDIYAGGDHFVPQERYRLNYTPSQSLASTPTGITNTQAAGSYMGYPSYEAWLLAQGGGDGGGNDIPVNRYDPNQNLGPTNITDYEADAYGVGSTWAGSWAKAKDLYSRLPTPGNLIMKGIRHWKTRSTEKKAQEQADAAAANQVQQNIQQYQITGRGGQGGDRPDTGINTPGGGKGQSPTGGNVEGTPFAQGGRIGFKDGLSAYQLFKLKELGYGNAGSNPGSYGGLGVLRDILKLHKYKDGGRIVFVEGGIARLL